MFKEGKSLLLMSWHFALIKLRIMKLAAHLEKNTLNFKYSGNGHYYVALKFETISGAACSWIGAVQHCQNLQTASKNGNFESIQSSMHSFL